MLYLQKNADGIWLIGVTPTGRTAMVNLTLNMKSPLTLGILEELATMPQVQHPMKKSST